MILDSSFYTFLELRLKLKKYLDEVYNKLAKAYTTHLNLTELMYHYGKEKGLESARTRVMLILESPIKVVATDEDLAIRSGELRTKYNFLSTVDCYIIALAEREKGTILTTDSKILEVYKDGVLLKAS